MRIKYILAGLLLVGLRFLLSGTASAQLAPETAARVDSVFSDLNRTDRPGCALGVIHGEQLAYAKGYGIANLDYQRPITPNTVFYLASVSKQFTAAAVILAERQGDLSLNDPVRRWLPKLPEYEGRTITLRHLVHHTSGLRDYGRLSELAGWKAGAPYETEDYLNLIYRQENLNFPPGTEYQYSNTNYLLLAEVVEAATGSTLQAFADENLFDPLGMRSTHFHDDRTHVIRNRAVGYAPAEQGVRMVHPWNQEEVGAGGLYASIEDLAQWDHNFDTQAVGGTDFAEQMTTRGRLANGDTLDYAFGLYVDTYRGEPTVGHGGGFTGFRTQYLRFPDADHTIIVLCNSTSADASTYAYSVADVVLRNRLDPRQDVAPFSSPTLSDAETNRAQNFDLLTGRYEIRSSDGVVLRITRQQGTLFAQRPGRTKVELVPMSGATFEAQPINARATFHTGSNGRADSVTVRQPGSRLVADRIGDVTSWVPSSEVRRAFEGRYHSDELGVDYRVVATGDGLQLVQGRRAPKPLRPRSTDVFSFGATGARIRFVRDEEGRVVGFEVNTSQVQGLRFERKR
jgi:CubicO group peptidase (beta-lactamase class C family)